MMCQYSRLNLAISAFYGRQSHANRYLRPTARPCRLGGGQSRRNASGSHTGQEIHVYEEMASKLIDEADSETLTLVARKLARCADAPASILNRIRARGGDAAREILQVSPQVEWRDLRQTASHGSAEM